MAKARQQEVLERGAFAEAPGVRELTLNRPGSRNALNRELLAALQVAVAQAADDDSVRVLVLKAAGPVFCAGHDLRELRQATEQQAAALFAACSELMRSLVASPVPVIAAVDGVATAAGCQLVASCDLAIATDRARFITPGVDIGLFCSTPAVALTRAVPAKVAMRMLLTGEPVDAATALDYGLVNEVVPAAQLDAAVRRLAATIARKSRATVALGKRALAAQRGPDLMAAYEVATRAMLENLVLEDAGEGIDAFLAGREPRWRDR